MEVYTNAELADAHLMYGLADVNGAAAQRLYRERFPDRRCPDRKTYEAIDRRLREHGTLKPNTGEGLEGRGHHNWMRQFFIQSTTTLVSVQDKWLQQINVDHMIVLRVLHENLLYPYHLERVQGLSVADFPARRHFYERYIQQCMNPNFWCNCAVHR